jgi:NAD(P)-dependent dehydrogenase (short-subunit alcohol dehydrogenase family)
LETIMTQTILITGASAGFGRAFALEALDRGYNVVATARSAGRVADLTALAPGRLLPLALDVDHPETFAEAIAAITARFGGIDVLINNAGYGLVGALEETPAEEWQAIFRTNLFGTVEMTRAVLPMMRARGRGAIVNISSMGGQMSWAGFSAYSATKFALEGLSEALADEVKAFGIRVMIVEPGAFRTDFAGAALRHMPVNPAYDATVGETRKFAHGLNHTQPGDPAKAAKAVFDALASEHPPLRLALGNDAVDGIRGHAEGVLKTLAEWEDVSRSAVFG